MDFYMDGFCNNNNNNNKNSSRTKSLTVHWFKTVDVPTQTGSLSIEREATPEAALPLHYFLRLV